MKNRVARTTLVCVVCVSLIFISLMLTGQIYAKIDPKTIVGIWLFDEGKGDVARDSSENGNDGTLMKSPKWVDGKFGKALSFGGVDDYVEVPTSESLEITGSISVTLWAYLEREVTSGTWNALVGKNPYVNAYLIWIQVPCNVCSLIYVKGQRINNCAWPGAPIELKKWYHLAFTREAKDGKMRLFVNGELVYEQISQSGEMDTHKGPLNIGGQSSPQFLNGIVDEVAIFNVALSEDDIKSIMTKGLSRVVGLTAVSPAGKLTTTWASIKAK